MQIDLKLGMIVVVNDVLENGAIPFQPGLLFEVWTRGSLKRRLPFVEGAKMMMSFICSCRNKLGAELHIYQTPRVAHRIRIF
jgi:hypothetical protein